MLSSILMSDADSIACSSSAVFPMPASPPQDQHAAPGGPRFVEQPVHPREQSAEVEPGS